MKSNDGRSENARNEARNSQGEFTSKGQGSQSHSSSHSNGGRGSNAQNEQRDSHGRFESDNNKK